METWFGMAFAAVVGVLLFVAGRASGKYEYEARAKAFQFHAANLACLARCSNFPDMTVSRLEYAARGYLSCMGSTPLTGSERSTVEQELKDIEALVKRTLPS